MMCRFPIKLHFVVAIIRGTMFDAVWCMLTFARTGRLNSSQTVAIGLPSGRPIESNHDRPTFDDAKDKTQDEDPDSDHLKQT